MQNAVKKMHIMPGYNCRFQLASIFFLKRRRISSFPDANEGFTFNYMHEGKWRTRPRRITRRQRRKIDVLHMMGDGNFVTVRLLLLIPSNASIKLYKCKIWNYKRCRALICFELSNNIFKREKEMSLLYTYMYISWAV